MKLIRKEGSEEFLIAEFENNKVTFLHPTIQRVINMQKCVVLPALKKYQDEFGSCRVAPDHEKYSRAVKIYLEFEFIPRAPNHFFWKNGDNNQENPNL